jgi:hypothetical protein
LVRRKRAVWRETQLTWGNPQAGDNPYPDWSGGLSDCGRYVVFREGDSDLWVYEKVTGTIVASRRQGLLGRVTCRDGYVSNGWDTQPPGFVFPEEAQCRPFDLAAATDADGNPD